MDDTDADRWAWALNDANFNVTTVLTMQFDPEQYFGVAERYSYTPYGELTVLEPDFTPDADNTSDYNWHNTFQGLRKDEVTGEYQARNRNLNSSTGTWNRRDDYLYFDSCDLYATFLAAPNANTDPTGTTTYKFSGRGYRSSVPTWAFSARHNRY